MTIEQMVEALHHPPPGARYAVVCCSQFVAVLALAAEKKKLRHNTVLEQRGYIVPGMLYWRMNEGSGKYGLIAHIASGFAQCSELVIPEEVSP